jgi:hypothetical protein
MVQYELQQAWTTIGIVMAVMMPIIIVLLALYLCYTKDDHSNASFCWGNPTIKNIGSDVGDGEDTAFKSPYDEYEQYDYKRNGAHSALKTDTISPPASTPSPRNEDTTPPSSAGNSNYRKNQPAGWSNEFKNRVYNENDESVPNSPVDSEATSTIRGSVLSSTADSPTASDTRMGPLYSQVNKNKSVTPV